MVLRQYASRTSKSAFPSFIGNHAALLVRVLALSVTMLFVALTLVAVWFGYMEPMRLLAALALIVGGGLMLAYFAARPILHPRRSQSHFTPVDYGIDNWEDVHFLAADGVDLEAWFVPPDPRGDGATIIFVHGLGGNRGDLLTEAAMLVSRGYGALMIDLRNHGRSRGTLTTLGYSEVEDVRGAVDYLLSRPEVNADRIGLFGYSMGGATVLRAAAQIPQVRAVIAQSAYSSLRENIEQGIVAKTGLPPFPFAPLMVWLGERITGLRIDQVCPIDDVARIAHCALLFVHGKEDDTVPVSNSLRLYDAAPEPKGLYLVNNASHSGLLFANPLEFERRVGDFLDRHLRGIKPRAALVTAG